MTPDRDRDQHFTISSIVHAPADQVWDRIASAEGINNELMPLARMTMPRGMRTLGPDTIPIGRRAFRSWILFLGFLPVDYDDLTIIELEPGRRFLERSTMLSQQLWEHERTVEPMGPAMTRVSDRLRYRTRLPLAWLYRPIFTFAFRHRHKRLRRHFGVPPGASALGSR